MKLSRASKVGVFLLTAGAVTLLGVAIWLKTTREILADFPMPMYAETVSRNFSVDHDGPLYEMRVHFGSAVSETTARCLLGATKSDRYPDLDCSNITPALKFSWELRRDGQTGGSGSSANTGTVLTRDGVTQVAIVAFPAQKNHRYEVTLKFERNADNVGIPPPRVQIELDSFVKEDLFIVGAILDTLAVILGLVGLTMLAIDFVRARLKRDSA
ncbi:MAG: hypothetical protein WA542_00975 [Candidatus Acidiferrum sp.]